ncbi:hypothetical protein [Halomontanus rarus]|uniref:hypothetical protein n=1 Tax=Halomontanus rarus TaxID=3034020 RepID=UPI0023E7DB47|nr:hypothetical protein [Halovivax sp. TS33]
MAELQELLVGGVEEVIGPDNRVLVSQGLDACDLVTNVASQVVNLIDLVHDLAVK